MKRRNFIKTALLASATGAAVSGGLLSSRVVFAAADADLLAVKSVDEALKALGAPEATESDKIKIKAPEIAENGAVVPIGVTSEIEGTSEILLLVSKNPAPFAGRYHFGKKTEPAIKSRLKMAKTSDVMAVVKAGDKFYTAKSNVKVTKGGCGG